MLLADAMKDDSGEYPDDGGIGRQRPIWYDIGKLTVDSGNLEIADLGDREGLRVRIPPGIFTAQARLIDFAGSLWLTRVRVFAQETSPELGFEEGSFHVDLAGCWIADFDTMLRDLSADNLGRLSRRASAMNVFCDLCSLDLPTKTVNFLACQSGLGDGEYAVFSLKDHRQTIGIEVEFLKDGHIFRHGPAR